MSYFAAIVVLLVVFLCLCWLDFTLRKRRIAEWDRKVREFDEKTRKWREVK